jgi:hypothetical protein
MRAQRNSASGTLFAPSLCRRGSLLRLSAFYPPNARYPHKVSAFTASLPFRTANRTDRWCAVSGSRAFFTCGRCSLDIPRAWRKVAPLPERSRFCGHAWQNQPLVVTDLARDPRFAESPFLINMDFAFTPECRCLVPARLAFRAAFSLESG